MFVGPKAASVAPPKGAGLLPIPAPDEAKGTSGVEPTKGGGADCDKEAAPTPAAPAAATGKAPPAFDGAAAAGNPPISPHAVWAFI